MPEGLEQHLLESGWKVDDHPTDVWMQFASHFYIKAGSDSTRRNARVADGYAYAYEVAILGSRFIFLEHSFGGFTGNQHNTVILFKGKIKSIEDFETLIRLLDIKEWMGMDIMKRSYIPKN